MFQQYLIASTARRFRTDLPVLSYGSVYGETVQTVRRYEDLEVSIRLEEPDSPGYGIDEIDGREYRTSFPHVVLKRPGLRHRFRTRGKRKNYFFCFPAEATAVLERYGMGFEQLIWPIQFNERMEGLFAEADKYAAILHMSGVPEKVDCIFWQIMLELFQYREASGPQLEYNEKKIRGIAAWLQSHCDEKFDFGRVAASFGMSRRSFYVHWQKHYPVTPAQFVTSQRINRSKFLLTHTNLSVTEIAAEQKFSSSIYFIRVFHTHVGMTPLRFRRENLNQD